MQRLTTTKADGLRLPVAISTKSLEPLHCCAIRMIRVPEPNASLMSQAVYSNLNWTAKTSNTIRDSQKRALKCFSKNLFEITSFRIKIIKMARSL